MSGSVLDGDRSCAWADGDVGPMSISRWVYGRLIVVV